MRIGIDITALPPQPVGAGNYIRHLVRHLAELDTPDELVIFAQPTGRALIDVESRPGFEWRIVPEKSPAFRLAWEQVVLPRLVRQSGVDLLHSPHYTRPWFLPCASVVTFHDMTFFLYPHLHTRARRLFFPVAMRASVRRADRLISVSESTRQDAIRLLGIPPEKITTVPLGVTQDFHRVTDRQQLTEVRQRCGLPERFLLFVGLVEPRKNLPVLLEAFSRLSPQAQIPLVIAGRMGWGAEAVLAQIERLGLKDQVRFTGYLSPQDLPIVYNLAEAFVYPSLYEGFGLPPLEAMACGTPVITSAVSSMPEHVGQAGLLTPPGDAEALAAALETVLTQPELRKEMRAKGLERAALFTWERTAFETYQIYRQTLGQR